MTLNANAPKIPCNPDGIPHDLRDVPQWVVWKLIPAQPKPRKVPFNPKTKREAKSSKPETWGTFPEATALFIQPGYAGVGFEFHTTDDFCGADIDNCRNPETGEITPEAWEFIRLANTYTEISQSGTGVKMIARAVKIGDRCKNDGVEMYDKKRFFALTGKHLAGTPKTIEDRQEEFAELYRRFFPEKPKTEAKPAAPRSAANRATAPCARLSDNDVLQKAFAEPNGKAQRLYNGDTGGYVGPSEARKALLNKFVFYTHSPYGGGTAQLESLFGSSALCNEKCTDTTRGSLTFAQYECQRAVDAYDGGFYDPLFHIGDTPELAPPPPLKSSDVFTFDAWKKRGDAIRRWKSATDNAFRWAAGDWWNAKTKGVQYGEKCAFLKKSFGAEFARQIQNYASVCNKWPADQRNLNLPFWVYVELAGQNEETRKTYLQKFREGGLTREVLREELGIPTIPRPKKSWQLVKEQFGEKIFDLLLEAAQREDEGIILKKIQAALAPEAAYDSNAAPLANHMSDVALIDDAQEHVRMLEADIRAEEAGETEGAEIGRNLMLTFHAGVKSETPFQSQNDAFSEQKNESDFSAKSEAQNAGEDNTQSVYIEDVGFSESGKFSAAALPTHAAAPAAPAVSTLTVTPADEPAAPADLLAPYAQLLTANLPEVASPPIPVPNCRGVTATGNPRLAVLCAGRNIRNGTGTGGPRGQVAILAAVLTWYERQAAQTVTL